MWSTDIEDWASKEARLGFPGMPTAAELAEAEAKTRQDPTEENRREVELYRATREFYSELAVSMTDAQREVSRDRWQRAGFALLAGGLVCVSMQALVPGLRAAGL
jgi:hypothetical protein